jgi:hypothetical protein
MKIQIIKKSTTQAHGGAICPWFIDVPPPDSKKN